MNEIFWPGSLESQHLPIRSLMTIHPNNGPPIPRRRGGGHLAERPKDRFL